MKTPEKIKNGLDVCATLDGDCEKCPYGGRTIFCADRLRKDALTYIQQLEANYQQVSKALCGKENATLDEVLQAVRQVKAELETVKRERDAAVTMLESINTCDTCINKVEAETTYISNDCFLYINMIKHKFRGVCPENTEVQDDD